MHLFPPLLVRVTLLFRATCEVGGEKKWEVGHCNRLV